MTTIPGRLHIDASGRLQGPAAITINNPFPTRNSTPGGFGTAYGGVIHTEVGVEHNVIDEFNNPASQASAFFSISMTGAIHQYVSLGHDVMAWTQVAGNPHWRGVEHEDMGHPETPMPPAQIAASAQVFEAMSAFDGWPLAPTDDPVNGRGIIFHSDGGVAWGNHDCPGAVRRGQRQVIIDLAKQIRAGAQAKPFPSGRWTADGQTSLAQLAARQGVSVTSIWWATFHEVLAAPAGSGTLGDLERAYLNHGGWTAAGPWTADMPSGMVVYLP